MSEFHLHWLFEILAYSVAFRLYIFWRKQAEDKINDSDRLWIFIAACGGGFIGSHLLGILERPFDWLFRPLSFLQFYVYFMSNKTILGGLLGGLIAVEYTKKQLRIVSSSGDLMTFPIIIGLIMIINSTYNHFLSKFLLLFHTEKLQLSLFSLNVEYQFHNSLQEDRLYNLYCF